MPVTLLRYTAKDFTLTDIAATAAKLLGSDWADSAPRHDSPRVTHTPSGMYVEFTVSPGVVDEEIDLNMSLGEYGTDTGLIRPDDDTTHIAAAMEAVTLIHAMRARFITELIADGIPMDSAGQLAHTGR